MSEDSELPVYEIVGGERLTAMVAAFYRRVPADPILGPMYPEQDFAGAEQRLCTFLIYRFGGPPTYLQQRGHPRLRMRHAPFAIDRAARDRWLELMVQAMGEVGIADDMRAYMTRFLGDIATFLMNRAGA